MLDNLILVFKSQWVLKILNVEIMTMQKWMMQRKGVCKKYSMRMSSWILIASLIKCQVNPTYLFYRIFVTDHGQGDCKFKCKKYNQRILRMSTWWWIVYLIKWFWKYWNVEIMWQCKMDDGECPRDDWSHPYKMTQLSRIFIFIDYLSLIMVREIIN